MIVLKQNQAFFKIFGLLLNENQLSNWNNIFTNILVSMPILGVLVFSIGYFIENISDVTKTTDATYVICALSLFFVQFWVFALQKIEFRTLINELQSIIDKSKFFWCGCSRKKTQLFPHFFRQEWPPIPKPIHFLIALAKTPTIRQEKWQLYWWDV